MEGLPVSYSLNSGDNGNNWWGDFIGAAIGGAAGAAWGRGNNNGCCGNSRKARLRISSAWKAKSS